MSIVTKNGDRGRTFLCYGARVSKDNPSVEACGALDELSSFLGLSKNLIKEQKNKKLIASIQKDLFVVGAEFATKPKQISKLRERIDDSYIGRLEKVIRDLEKNYKSKQRCFCLPGENFASSVLDIARAIARRAERLSVTLKRKKLLLNGDILIYLNRLSDLLYLLARLYGKNQGNKN